MLLGKEMVKYYQKERERNDREYVSHGNGVSVYVSSAQRLLMQGITYFFSDTATLSK
jgi:hypothetical protein